MMPLRTQTIKKQLAIHTRTKDKKARSTQSVLTVPGNMIAERNVTGPRPLRGRGPVTSHSPTGFDVFLSAGALKNRSFKAFGVSRSEIGIAERNVTVTPWSGCDE